MIGRRTEGKTFIVREVGEDGADLALMETYDSICSVEPTDVIITVTDSKSKGFEHCNLPFKKENFVGSIRKYVRLLELFMNV